MDKKKLGIKIKGETSGQLHGMLDVALTVEKTDRKILDVCCGSRMFWFDKENPEVFFGDIRNENHVLCDGRKLDIKPDMQLDFRKLPFEDNAFKLIVFDPPHLDKLGKNSWMAKKYGMLSKTWQEDIASGFRECFRVLEFGGILIFKWNEVQIKTREVLELSNTRPLFGHLSGKRSDTHWICFMNI
ncbi:SAM-dependent methyltransferase [hydrothermal vent metagenome]|uniref:SAM-dependent methyltransferase n=1 Tax=hydrothermal vent metagenome TaxID=652676 RepID=A0A3B0VIS4_9ZZZZ